jgi:alpha-L-fucosidase
MFMFQYPYKQSQRIRQQASLTPNPGQQAQMDRQFGMFLHFGVNTFGNTEWSDGGIDPRSYKPEAIDTDGWARTAWEAGMNYVILITKHHDGFCLWNTKTTRYGVTYSGNTVDVVGELAGACKKYGIKLGLYYSLWDRKHPGYKTDFAGVYVPYMLEQITELMDGRYGEVVELWLDGSWDKAMYDWRLDLIYDTVKRLQPLCQIGVNHTVGSFTNTPGFDEQDRWKPMNHQRGDPLRMFPSDFRLWDGYPCREEDPKIFTWEGEEYYMPFEMTICSREGFSWFYSNIYEEKPLLPVDRVAADCRTAFAAGNPVVINLPPNTNGRLVPEDRAHLMEIARQLGTARI